MRKIIPPRRENNFKRIPSKNDDFRQQKSLIHMSWKFPRLTEISPTADRANLFSHMNAFYRLSEIKFSYEAGEKK